MGGLIPPKAIDRGIESTLRDRSVVAASLVLVVALAWLYLWHDAAMMADMAGMTMPLPGLFVMTFLMWTVMMAGMMLPGAAPAILLYAAMVRRNGERGTLLPAVWIFVGGYLAAWTAFSLAVAAMQIAMERAAMLTPAMTAAHTGLSAGILIAAGVYQWLPLKNVCLAWCRQPLQFFLTRWRSGAAGTFRMGAEHGMYCVGCCWALMLLLFVAGVMNLLWVALIAAFVLLEKLLPAGVLTARLAGAALVLAGVGLLMRS